MSSILSNISKGITRANVDFSQKLRVKGYGGGSMMMKIKNDLFVLNLDKVRKFIVPKWQDIHASELQPYIQQGTPVQKEKLITKWDFFRTMEKHFESQDAKGQEMIRSKVQELSENKKIGVKAGWYQKWGF